MTCLVNFVFRELYRECITNLITLFASKAVEVVPLRLGEKLITKRQLDEILETVGTAGSDRVANLARFGSADCRLICAECRVPRTQAQ